MPSDDRATGSSRKWPAYALCTALGIYMLYFARLGGSPLMDPDEPVYGQVAKEMAHGAGWLTPHFNGRPWFDKPPLFYWLSGASASVFGVNEFAVRLPSALMGLALVLLVYALALRDFGRRGAVISAVVMATCLQQIVLARAAVTDMTLAVCLTASLYAYRRWLDAEGRGRFGWMALCGAMTGFGMLTKGPVAPLLLFVAFCIHLLWTRRFRRLLALDALLGVACMLIVGLPWFIAMYLLHKQEFIQGFLIANNIQRFTTAEHPTATGKWYSYLLNVPVLFGFFFPWSIFLIQAIRGNWRINDGAKLAVAWFATVFIFFSLSKTLLVTYIFPLFPAAALLVGALLSSAAHDEEQTIRSLRSALWVGLAVSLFLIIALARTAHSKFPEGEKAACIAGAILVLMFVVALARAFSKSQDRPGQVVAVIGVGMAVFGLWLACGLVPSLAGRLSTKVIAPYVPTSPSVRVIQFRLSCPSLLFYSGRLPERLGYRTLVMNLFARSTQICFIVRKNRAWLLRQPNMTEQDAGDFVVLTKTGVP